MHINKAFQQKLAELLSQLPLLPDLQGSYTIFIWHTKEKRTEKINCDVNGYNSLLISVTPTYYRDESAPLRFSKSAFLKPSTVSFYPPLKIPQFYYH